MNVHVCLRNKSLFTNVSFFKSLETIWKWKTLNIKATIYNYYINDSLSLLLLFQIREYSLLYALIKRTNWCKTIVTTLFYIKSYNSFVPSPWMCVFNIPWYYDLCHTIFIMQMIKQIKPNLWARSADNIEILHGKGGTIYGDDRGIKDKVLS